MNINIPSVPVVLPPNLMEAPNVDHHHLNTFLSPDKDKDFNTKICIGNQMISSAIWNK